MKILIVSSSYNPDSKSRKICLELKNQLENQENIHVDYLDLRNVELKLCHQEHTESMKDAAKKVEQADCYILGMAVYNYSVNDSLKVFLDNCFPGKANKLFGIVCAAGGERSYLATMHLNQIMVKEWRMIPLPRVIYATGKDFTENGDLSEGLNERIEQFRGDFCELAERVGF